MVMRARSNVYHLECFACQQCNHRFCVGDRFYLCENKILCEYDYEERLVFASMANHPMLKRQASGLSAPGPPPPSSVSLHSQAAHPLIQPHHGAVVNGHRATPQGDLNNNSPLATSPFGGGGNKGSGGGGCQQSQLGAAS